ncbi:MAG: hypothetical protein HFH41_00445 [Lachnospiraceae bacterium]|nr:hypothetical protein [Lachnospiraceae bacterium]
MYCMDFAYDKEKLSDYGMMLCNFNHSNSLETLSSGADITFHQISAGRNPRFPLYASTYDTAYTASFQICKNPCLNTSGTPWLSPWEVSALQKWLCRKNRYHRFKIDQEDYQTLYWKSVFSAKQVMMNGKIAGMELTMYTDSPYAYRDEATLEFECRANEPFSVYSLSDEEGCLYPWVEITCREMETDDSRTDTFLLELSNTLDQKTTQIKGCRKGEILTLDGEHFTISSSEKSHVSLARDFNYYFPRIINTYENNKNDFTLNRDCTLLLRYSPVCRIGL